VRNSYDAPVTEDAASQHLLQMCICFDINSGLWIRQLIPGRNHSVQLKGTGLTVASSRTRMLLGVSSARASETSCRCPWLRFDPVVRSRPKC
jgi:hypothetical protein